MGFGFFLFCCVCFQYCKWGRAMWVTRKHQRLRRLQLKEKWPRHWESELWVTIIASVMTVVGSSFLTAQTEHWARQKHKVASTRPNRNALDIPNGLLFRWFKSVGKPTRMVSRTSQSKRRSVKAETLRIKSVDINTYTGEHEAEGRWQRGREKDADHRIHAHVKETWKGLYNDQNYPQQMPSSSL